MSEQIVLSNDILKISLSTLGAEITSVKKNDNDLIWIGDPNIWKFHAPLVFPICGMLKDNKYRYKGAEYTLLNHGYGRFIEFEIERYNKNKVIFLHSFNEETLKVYPFKYELRVIYTLEKSVLKVEYAIRNLDSGKMYFSIGSHEAYYCPEGIEEYSVLFEYPEDLNYSVYSDGLLEYNTGNLGENVVELPLKYDYFEKIPLTFLKLKSKTFYLKNRKTGKNIKLRIDDNHTSFTIFTRKDRPYICLEPWCGMPDYVDSDFDFKHKKGIVEISEHAEKIISHEIEF